MQNPHERARRVRRAEMVGCAPSCTVCEAWIWVMHARSLMSAADRRHSISLCLSKLGAPLSVKLWIRADLLLSRRNSEGVRRQALCQSRILRTATRTNHVAKLRRIRLSGSSKARRGSRPPGHTRCRRLQQDALRQHAALPQRMLRLPGKARVHGARHAQF